MRRRSGEARSWEMPEDAWRKVMDVNINGVFHTCRAAARQMTGAGGGVHRHHRVDRRPSCAARSHRLRHLQGGGHPDDPRPGPRARSDADPRELHCTRPDRHAARQRPAPGSWAPRPRCRTRPHVAPSAGSARRRRSPTRRSSSCPNFSSYITGETLVVDGGVSVHLRRPPQPVGRVVSPQTVLLSAVSSVSGPFRRGRRRDPGGCLVARRGSSGRRGCSSPTWCATLRRR